MTSNTKPILAITMGDPAGTGPELIAKALTAPEVVDVCRPVVIGDAAVLRDAVHVTGSRAMLRVIDRAVDAGAGETIDVIDLRNVLPAKFTRGQVSAHAGSAAYDYIKRSVELTLAGEAHAVVTSAINKAALHAAGYHYDGHTELLAELCGKPEVTMMLVAEKLRVCHVSTHVSLRDAIERVKPERILSVVRLARAGAQELGIRDPHIAIAGLNPHAGE